MPHDDHPVDPDAILATAPPASTPAPPTSLNVLYVGTLPPHPGGSAVSGAGLVAGLAALGHGVRALAPVTPESLANGGCPAPHPGVRVVTFPVPYFAISPDRPAEPAYRQGQRDAIHARLPALIEAERPDLVFIGRESFAGDVADVARTHAVPCMLRLAGGAMVGLLQGNYPEGLARELLAACRRMQRIVSPARHLAARARALGLNDIVVIPNAVDIARFAPRPKSPALLRSLGIPDDAILVAHISNLKPIKRAIDVVRSARDALPRDPRLVYLIVGDGPARPAMEEAARRAGAQDRIRFVGWVEYSRMPDYVNLADLVVMPSEDEALARVYLETQACGRVLLASDIPAAREVVVDGRTGLLFRTGDIGDLTEKTLRAAADAGLRVAIGRAAREHVGRHRLADAVGRYATLMAELAREWRPSGAGSEPVRGR